MFPSKSTIISNLSWEYNGTLEKFKINLCSGVYLFVYKGFKKRILYAGISNCFERRWTEHNNCMTSGNRPIWKAAKDQDIYELISYKGESNFYKYYHSLAIKGYLWASTGVLQINPVNYLNKNDIFDTHWKDYCINSYMPMIEIWSCSMGKRFNYASILESQIQRSVSKNFYIGSHLNSLKNNMSWLGKIEHTSNIFDIRFQFNTLPDLDSDTQFLLNNLSDERILKFNKSGQHEKDQLRIKRNREKKALKIEVKKRYPYSFTTWYPQENNILLFLFKKDVPLIDIGRILQREPQDVQKQIERMKKWGWLNI